MKAVSICSWGATARSKDLFHAALRACTVNKSKWEWAGTLPAGGWGGGVVIQGPWKCSLQQRMSVDRACALCFAVYVYRQLQLAGFKPDGETHELLIKVGGLNVASATPNPPHLT